MYYFNLNLLNLIPHSGKIFKTSHIIEVDSIFSHLTFYFTILVLNVNILVTFSQKIWIFIRISAWGAHDHFQIIFFFLFLGKLIYVECHLTLQAHDPFKMTKWPGNKGNSQCESGHVRPTCWFRSKFRFSQVKMTKIYISMIKIKKLKSYNNKSGNRPKLHDHFQIIFFSWQIRTCGVSPNTSGHPI